MSNLAEKFEVQKIPLANIRRDGGTQPRAELNEEWAQECVERMQQGVSFPAVSVFYDGTDYWLADGFHRCRAAELAQITEINADIFSGTRQDARDYANSGKPNGRHGLRESKADRWRRVETMLIDHPDWSTTQVAGHCEVSQPTVSRVRQNLSYSVNKIDAPDRTVTRNGTTYTMNTGNIGQRDESQGPPEPVNNEAPAPIIPLVGQAEVEESEPLSKHVHVSANSGNNEWYTPPEYIELARTAMGGIDTDPATSEFANKAVKAHLYFTAESDGRGQQWQGSVWMNPPYAQPLMSDFAEAVTAKYLDGEIEQACVLVNNATETGWFQRLMDGATAVAFLRGRVRYLDAQGNPANTPLQGQAIVYMGSRVEEFKAAFAERGRVLTNG